MINKIFNRSNINSGFAEFASDNCKRPIIDFEKFKKDSHFREIDWSNAELAREIALMVEESYSYLEKANTLSFIEDWAVYVDNTSRLHRPYISFLINLRNGYKVRLIIESFGWLQDELRSTYYSGFDSIRVVELNAYKDNDVMFAKLFEGIYDDPEFSDYVYRAPLHPFHLFMFLQGIPAYDK